jgi:hypothetical protein
MDIAGERGKPAPVREELVDPAAQVARVRRPGRAVHPCPAALPGREVHVGKCLQYWHHSFFRHHLLPKTDSIPSTASPQTRPWALAHTRCAHRFGASRGPGKQPRKKNNRWHFCKQLSHGLWPRLAWASASRPAAGLQLGLGAVRQRWPPGSAFPPPGRPAIACH